MPLSSADIEDARRYAGYPVAASLPFFDALTQGGSTQLDVILAALTDDQVTILQNVYLVPLRTLEAAIPAAGDNLDTEKAAVWTHNTNEISDRAGLFALLRFQLCMFLGIPPGSGIAIGAASGAIALGLAPAVFTT